MVQRTIQITDLTAQTSVPTSINLVVTQRIGGVEKAALLKGIDLTNLGSDVDLTSVFNRVQIASAAAARAVSVATSVNSRSTSVDNVLDARVTSVKNRVDTHINLIQSNALAISSAQGKIASFDSRVSQVSARVSQISVVAAAFSSASDRLDDVSALAQSAVNLAAQVSQVSVLAAGAASVTDRLDTISAQNTSVGTLVGTLNTRVDNVSGNIGSNTARITSVNSKVDNRTSITNVRFTSVASRQTSIATKSSAQDAILRDRIAAVSLLAVGVSSGGDAFTTSAEHASVVAILTDNTSRIATVSSEVVATNDRITSINTQNFGDVTVLSGASVVISAVYDGWSIMVNHNASVRAVVKSGPWTTNRETKIIQRGTGTVSIAKTESLGPSGTGQIYYPIRLNKTIPPGFPIPIHHSMLPTGWTSRVQADGGDLRVYTSVSGDAVKNPLPLDIAKIDTAASILASFTAASVTLAQNSKIYLHVNASVCSQPADSDPLGYRAVWWRYRLATHDFTEDRTAFNTSMSINGTLSVTDTSVINTFNGYPVRAFGPEYGSSTSDYVRTGVRVSSAAPLIDDLTVTTYVRPMVSAFESQRLFYHNNWGVGSASNNRLAVVFQETGPFAVREVFMNIQPKDWIVDGVPRVIGTTHNYGVGNQPKMYVSASLVNILIGVSVHGGGINVNTQDFYIGNYGPSKDIPWRGYMSGFRLLTSAQDDNWMELEDETYRNPSSIAEASAVVSNTTGGGVSVTLSVMSRGDLFTMNGQHGIASLLFVNASTAYLSGDLT